MQYLLPNKRKTSIQWFVFNTYLSPFNKRRWSSGNDTIHSATATSRYLQSVY